VAVFFKLFNSKRKLLRYRILDKLRRLLFSQNVSDAPYGEYFIWSGVGYVYVNNIFKFAVKRHLLLEPLLVETAIHESIHSALSDVDLSLNTEYNTSFIMEIILHDTKEEILKALLH